MEYANIRRIGADTHEVNEHDLLVMDDTLRVLHDGKLYGVRENHVTGKHDYEVMTISKLQNVHVAYTVPPTVRDNPTTTEHRLYTEIMAYITKQEDIDAIRKTKIKANKPGHVYVDSKDNAYLYIGNRTMLNPATMQTLSGHIYIMLSFNSIVKEVDNKLIVNMDYVRARAKVNEHNELEFNAWTHITAYNNPRTMIMEVPFIDKPLAGLALGTLSGIILSSWSFKATDGNLTLYPLTDAVASKPAKKQVFTPSVPVDDQVQVKGTLRKDGNVALTLSTPVVMPNDMTAQLTNAGVDVKAVKATVSAVYYVNPAYAYKLLDWDATRMICQVVPATPSKSTAGQTVSVAWLTKPCVVDMYDSISEWQRPARVAELLFSTNQPANITPNTLKALPVLANTLSQAYVDAMTRLLTVIDQQGATLHDDAVAFAQSA